VCSQQVGHVDGSLDGWLDGWLSCMPTHKITDHFKNSSHLKPTHEITDHFKNSEHLKERNYRTFQKLSTIERIAFEQISTLFLSIVLSF